MATIIMQNMMRKITVNYLILLVSVLSFSSCSTTVTWPNGKQIDKKLVGTWEGSEMDKQVAGMKKEWKKIRRDDGTFTLDFTMIQNGETDKLIDNGNWWVEGSNFFEFHENSDKTDTYKYVVLRDNQIQFEMINSEMEFADSNYTFIDTRVADQQSNESAKDGLSVENAIKVKSVSEEYEYVRKSCKGCQLLGQSLISHKGNPYDVIRLKKEDGTEVSYFFDISSFYGKW